MVSDFVLLSQEESHFIHLILSWPDISQKQSTSKLGVLLLYAKLNTFWLQLGVRKEINKCISQNVTRNSHISTREVQDRDQHLFSTHNNPSVWGLTCFSFSTHVLVSAVNLWCTVGSESFLKAPKQKTHSTTRTTWAINWDLTRIWSAKKKTRERDHTTNLAIWLTVAQKVLFNLIESFWAVN